MSKYLAQKLALYKQTWLQKPFVIYDPVAVASTGGEMAEEGITEVIKSLLLPQVDLLTPNANEAFNIIWACIDFR